MILDEGFEKTDYVTIADARQLTEITEWNGETKLVALVAAFIGGVRLIDNMPLN
jgi:pantoate--beta-alanine ligase